MPHHRAITFLVTTLAALAFAGCREKAAAPATAPGSSPPLPKIILQTDWYAQPEHGGFYQALVKGYYREAGLDVEISQGGPNSLPAPQVVMGKAQFALSRSDDVIVAFGRGIPLVMVGALMQRDPQAIMFHKESGIRDFKDLDKRRIMSVPGSGFVPLMERKYGIKVSVTPLDFGLSRFMADKQFVQQCFITNEPFYVKQQGADVGVLLLSETGFSPYRVWFTSRDFIAKHPDLVRAFTAASVRGWRDYLEGDRTAADQRIAQLNPKMTPEFIAYSVGAIKDYKLASGDPAAGESYGQIRAARLEEQIRQLTEIGVLERPVKVADVFDGSFLPDSAK